MNKLTPTSLIKVIVLSFASFILSSCVENDSSTDTTAVATAEEVVANRFFSSVVTSKRFLSADGNDSAIITVQLKSAANENKTKGGDNVVILASSGTLSAVQDNNDGTYTATLTSATEQDLAIVTATVNDGSGKATDGVINSFAGVAMRVNKTEASFIALSALGKKIFEDTSLSIPEGQSCASCHGANVGFDDPDDGLATSQGARTDAVIFGQRNAQTVQYAAFTPKKQIINTALPKLIGGQFWDGRAATLKIQTGQPFLNPLEMNNPDKASVIAKISNASYKAEFEAIFGTNNLSNVESAYDNMEKAITAFLQSDEISPFTSKFDAVQKGNATYTESEARGEVIFNTKALCKECHFTPTELGEQVFTNFEYFNIGVPKNPANLFLNTEPTYIDLGLAEDTNEARDRGKFKTPSLRNIAKTAPYMHNGVFTTLSQVIDFYNDDLGGTSPEVNENLERGNQYLGFGLTPQEKLDLEAFLNTLSDL